MARFPSLKAKKLIRVLEAQPLGYRIARQKGSHRKMEAPNHPAITFAFHDNQTIRPRPSRTSSAIRSALPNVMRSRYSEEAMTVRVLYRQDEDTWVASSPDVPRWTVVADTYAEAHQLAEEGVRFALEREDLTVEHYVPAGVAVAA
jgi:predicted RNA binding protein YcfA (HicA-like mRNA interferase family)/predicted RNase H-like HicB family nuclease